MPVVIGGFPSRSSLTPCPRLPVLAVFTGVYFALNIAHILYFQLLTVINMRTIVLVSVVVLLMLARSTSGEETSSLDRQRRGIRMPLARLSHRYLHKNETVPDWDEPFEPFPWPEWLKNLFG